MTRKYHFAEDRFQLWLGFGWTSALPADAGRRWAIDVLLHAGCRVPLPAASVSVGAGRTPYSRNRHRSQLSSHSYSAASDVIVRIL
jgi:hypothetical protein